MKKLSQEEVQTIRTFLIQREKAFERERKAKLKEAQADFQKIVAMIANKYRPNRIYQWESLLHSENFRDYSDIDIAVKGIEKAKVFFEMYGEAERLTRFPLDLVQMEKIHPLHAQSIRSRGRLVYSAEEDNGKEAPRSEK